MAQRLTEREQRALTFIQSREPCPPSLGELANHLGVSQAGAAYFLRQLQAKGWIVIEARRHRAVATIAAPRG
jgi:DNA-binding MarR family transcriptional regulator